MRKAGPEDALVELKGRILAIIAEEGRLRRSASDDLLRADVLHEQLIRLQAIVDIGENAHGGGEDREAEAR